MIHGSEHKEMDKKKMAMKSRAIKMPQEKEMTVMMKKKKMMG